MYKEKFSKYCDKINHLKMNQIGGTMSKEDYIFSLSPPVWPRQLDNIQGTSSWFYCPVIWMALDELFDQYETDKQNGNDRRREILKEIGRSNNGEDNINFFGKMRSGWDSVLKSYCDEMKDSTLCDILNIIKDDYKNYFRLKTDEEIINLLKDKTYGSWHIDGQNQNKINLNMNKSTNKLIYNYPRDYFSTLKYFLAIKQQQQKLLEDVQKFKQQKEQELQQQQQTSKWENELKQIEIMIGDRYNKDNAIEMLNIVDGNVNNALALLS